MGRNYFAGEVGSPTVLNGPPDSPSYLAGDARLFRSHSTATQCPKAACSSNCFCERTRKTSRLHSVQCRTSSWRVCSSSSHRSGHLKLNEQRMIAGLVRDIRPKLYPAVRNGVECKRLQLSEDGQHHGARRSIIFEIDDSVDDCWCHLGARTLRNAGEIREVCGTTDPP